ncbi:MAG: ArsR/SmtB family transcription factor [Candidatus Dormibacteria bacterium]
MATTVETGSEAPSRVKGCCVQLAPPLPGHGAEALAEVFKALADPTRVQMIHMLKAAAEPVCVCDFTAAIDLGQPTVSHHLARLRDAGLVTSFRRGVWAFYRLRSDLSEPARLALSTIP